MAIGGHEGTDLFVGVVGGGVAGLGFGLPLVAWVLNREPSSADCFTHLCVEVVHQRATVAGLDGVPYLMADGVGQLLLISEVVGFADVDRAVDVPAVGQRLLAPGQSRRRRDRRVS